MRQQSLRQASVLSAWSQAAPVHSSQVESQFLAFLSVPADLQAAKGAFLRCTGLQDWSGSTHSLHRVRTHPCDLPLPLSLLSGFRACPDAFLFILPDYVYIFLIALVVWEFFCQVLGSFP